MPTEPVSDPDEFYGLPFEEFVLAHDALDREVRRAGNREEADRIRALRKPSQSACAQPSRVLRASEAT